MTAIASPESIVKNARANAETALNLSKSVFASAERLAALNLNTARSVLEDSVAATRTLLDSKDPKAMLGLQAALIKSSLEKVVAYSRSVYEIATATTAEFSILAESQLAEVNTSVADLLQKASKSAPAGSEAAVAAIKNAVGATNTAIERLNKASKEATSKAEAQVGAATEATLKAVGAALAKLPA